jgi:dolichol-phosphate mannosyltransferase
VLKSVDFESVESNGYAFQVEMNYLCRRAGFRIVEVPVIFPDRAAGASKMSMPIFLEAAGLVFKLRTWEILPNSRYSRPIRQPVTDSQQ